MADVNRGNRPLSPHLSIYKPQITSITSILTRITGNALLISTVLAVWWFMAAASGPAAFAIADSVLTSWFGDIVLFLSRWGIWYHMLAGLRHLIWDAGYGLDLTSATRLGWSVIIGSVIMTLATVTFI